MEKDNRLIAVSHLMNLAVLSSTSKKLIGKVADLIIAPVEGVAVGIKINMNAGSECALLCRNFILEVDKVFVCDEFADPENLPILPTGVIKASSELVGASIVTEEGKLIGHVRDIFLEPETLNLLYKVSVPGWRGIFRNKYFLAGDFPYSYSRFRNRLIVPSNSVIHTSPEAILRKGCNSESGFILSSQPSKLVLQEYRQQR